MKREWPPDWSERVAGKACPMCAEGRPEVAHGSSRNKDEASAYFDEALRVGRAIEQHHRPIKMNFEMLGNSLPHLHTHVVPRYLDDGEPGHPPHFMRADLDLKNAPSIPEQAYARDLAALRELLRG